MYDSPSSCCTVTIPTAEPEGHSLARRNGSAGEVVLNCCAVQRSVAVGLPARPGGSFTSISRRFPSAAPTGSSRPGASVTVFSAKVVVYW
jgi:hypothetical protein